MIHEILSFLQPEMPEGYVVHYAWLAAALPFIGMGVNALGGLFGAKSASKSRRKAEQMQQQQIGSAQDFASMSERDYANRAPMRGLAQQMAMQFRGSPVNPFNAGIFRPDVTAAPGGPSGGAPPGGGMQTTFTNPQPGQPGGFQGGAMVQPATQPGMPGAFNPYPQIDPNNSLIGRQITPQFDRGPLDALLAQLMGRMGG